MSPVCVSMQMAQQNTLPPFLNSQLTQHSIDDYIFHPAVVYCCSLIVNEKP